MIQEKEINFRSLVFDVNVGIYLCDVGGRIIYANYALARIFGFKRHTDIIGKSFSDFLSPGSSGLLLEQFQNSKERRKHADALVTEATKKDGTSMYIEIKPTPFFKDGNLAGNQGAVHDITQHKQSENNKMAYLSTHDSLTGLYYRTFFETELKRLERGRQFPVSIIVVNVANLNKVSDLETHGLGDKLLKRVAKVLFYTFRGDDIVARIGENDFAVLLPYVDDPAIKAILKRIHLNLSKNNNSESGPDLEFNLGTSTAKKGESLQAAFERAESVAYLAKKKNEPA